RPRIHFLVFRAVDKRTLAPFIGNGDQRIGHGHFLSIAEFSSIVPPRRTVFKIDRSPSGPRRALADRGGWTRAFWKNGLAASSRAIFLRLDVRGSGRNLPLSD